ncbi:MAG: hypothetical protein AAF585_03865 [Verrucomicrobiota bacterium]
MEIVDDVGGKVGVDANVDDVEVFADFGDVWGELLEVSDVAVGGDDPAVDHPFLIRGVVFSWRRGCVFRTPEPGEDVGGFADGCRREREREGGDVVDIGEVDTAETTFSPQRGYDKI